MTGSPASRASYIRTSGALLASLALLTACGSKPEALPRITGHALGGDAEASTYTGFENAEIGEEYRFALPLPYNKSAKDLTITGARVVHVPPGMKVMGMSAHAMADTDDAVIATARSEGDLAADALNRAKDLIDEPIEVKAKSLGDRYYVVRIKVTGPVKGDVETCHFEYRQGSRDYHQIIGCHFVLKLQK
ncbi:hypothetical protein [Streptomyces sp. NPDC020965]|uniref:hypothetical protein n=1 Tax=Streptomyces sp. NPDC020965 TaxID=3365105 RepID=UPI0037A69E4B